MKKIFPFLIIAVLFGACDTEDSNKKSNSNSKIEEKTASKSAEKEEVSDSSNSAIKYKPIDSKSAKIATALLAAPEASRENSTVKGYDENGKLMTLKEGSNEFICLADNPNKDGFSAACYHKSLEPFMARGRSLKAEGKDGREIFKIREKEIKSGKLKMGDAGSSLHVYYGPKAVYDSISGAVLDAKYRYVVYLPFATSESTGLPESPLAPNHPWIMDPGTHKAHIMISPM